MIGAIYGDIAGSVYEYNNVKRKNINLFGKGCTFTDDTVLTVAVAEALASISGAESDEKIKGIVSASLLKWGKAYPNADYGGGFWGWLQQGGKMPYFSYGNGSAMRTGAVAWCSSSLDEAIRLATLTASVTHNHPDGIAGAVATSGAAYLAINGADKATIRAFVERYYPLNFTLDEIRPTYKYEISCKGTVPAAIVAFLEAQSFEDSIRNAISLGGDSDTLAAITGAVAEGYYGMKDVERNKALSYLPVDLFAVATKFLKEKILCE